jgi:hypothetical protein
VKEGEDWPQLLARRLTRRKVLRATLLGGAGLAGIAIVGCRGKEETKEGTIEPTPGPEGTPTERPLAELKTPEPGLARLGWVQLQPPGESPSPRLHHSLVWDDAEARVRLFGGRSAGTPLNDLWSLNVDDPAWEQVQPGGPLPPPRFGHNAVFDPRERRMVIFGGQAGEAFFNDLWAFTSQDNAWTEITPAGPAPAPRQGAGAALDAEAGRLYVTHGLTAQGYLDDTWALDLTSATWEDISPPTGRPPKRCFLRAIWDPPSGQLLLFGGESDENPFLGDIWAFDPVSRAWEALPPGDRSPPPRSQYGAALVPDRGWIFVFGGAGEGGNLRDLWFYVPSVRGWGYTTIYGKDPGGHRGHDMAFVPHRLSIVLFGGVRGDQELQEVWEFGLGRPDE